MACRRNYTRDQIIDGLKDGKVMNVDRSDAPELKDLRELEKEGFVTCEVVDLPQLTVLKFRWKKK